MTEHRDAVGEHARRTAVSRIDRECRVAPHVVGPLLHSDFSCTPRHLQADSPSLSFPLHQEPHMRRCCYTLLIRQTRVGPKVTAFRCIGEWCVMFSWFSCVFAKGASVGYFEMRIVNYLLGREFCFTGVLGARAVFDQKRLSRGVVSGSDPEGIFTQVTQELLKVDPAYAYLMEPHVLGNVRSRRRKGSAGT